MNAEPAWRRGSCTFRAAAVTHRGKVRERNEDAIWFDGRLLGKTGIVTSPLSLVPGFHVALLADGMGGHSSGQVASAAALGHLAAGWEERRDVHGWARALQAANDRIYDLMGEQTGLLGMGTTIVGAAFDADLLIHFNVGDSRAYRLTSGSLLQVTHDDTPRTTQAAGAFRTHMVTQALGGRTSRTAVRPHVNATEPLARGEALLLCSDGLTDMVSDADLRAAMLACEEPGECVGRLLDEALDAGGVDNVSIILVRGL